VFAGSNRSAPLNARFPINSNPAASISDLASASSERCRVWTTAEEIAEDWGYRRLDTYGGFAGFRRRRSAYDLGWLSDDVTVAQALGSPETTAQVHPGQFTAALMRAAEAQGAELRLGRVTGITQYEGRATGVEVDGNVVEGDAMVIAMGPWSILAACWLPVPAVFGLKGHSLVFDTGAKIPAEAAFLEYQERSGAVLTPELFPRTDGTTYVCAISSEEPLPVDPARVAPDPGAIARLEAMCSSMSPVLASAKILARQACYRPVTRDGLPLIGPVPGVAGAYIATGHSVWGILNAPATGEAMAELIVDGTAQASGITTTAASAPADAGVPSCRAAAQTRRGAASRNPCNTRPRQDASGLGQTSRGRSIARRTHGTRCCRPPCHGHCRYRHSARRWRGRYHGRATRSRPGLPACRASSSRDETQ
jgi:glycine/D-amino acid oxidase-like deaminating enzyme